MYFITCYTTKLRLSTTITCAAAAIGSKRVLKLSIHGIGNQNIRNMDYSILSILLVLILVLLYYINKKKHNYWKSRNIPYLDPTPFFGNALRFLLNRENYHQLIKRIYDSNPDQPYIGMYKILTPILVIRDPKLCNDISIKNFQSFSARDMEFFLRPNKSLNPLSDNIVSYNGLRWKYMRQIQNPIFTSLKNRQTLFQFAFNSIKQMKLILDKSQGDAHLTDLCRKYTLNIICPWILGVDLNSFEQENSDIVKACEETLNVNYFVRNILYGIHPKLLELLRIPDFSAKSAQVFMTLIRKAMEYRKTNNIRRNDFLELITDAVENPSEKLDEKYDEYDIFGNVFGILVGSFESTTTTLAHAFYELALNEDIQDRARDEVSACLEETNGKLELETLNHMKYIDMILSETLRKYPTDAVNFRRCTEKFFLSTTKSWIEPGTFVFLPTYGFHHDPKYYPAPEKFDPERFTSKNKASIPAGAYIPFGEGPRICLGMRSSMIMMKVALFEILQNYKLSVGEKTQIPIKFMNGTITLTPENGIWLKVDKLPNLSRCS